MIILPEITLERQGHYTYEDYHKLPDDKRWEVIEGFAYQSTLGETERHQRILRRLVTSLDNYIYDFANSYELFGSPLDVYLSPIKPGEPLTVVQPDIFVSGLPMLIEGKEYFGSPDMIIEIASNITIIRDAILKRNVYERYGILEYWIIEPTNRMVVVNVLMNKVYKSFIYQDGNTIRSTIFPGFEMNVSEIFGPVG